MHTARGASAAQAAGAAWRRGVAAAMLVALTACHALDNEEVVFFPSAGYYDPRLDLWALPVQGWVYEPKRYDLLRRIGFHLLARDMSQREMKDAGLIFQRRADLFIVDGTPGVRVKVLIAGRAYQLPASDPSGRFERTFYIEPQEAQLVAPDGRLVYKALLPWDRLDPEPITGEVRLVPVTGVSVISDIDDTIKVSNVSEKFEMVRTMFVREFEAVEGMAQAYRRWGEQGAMFHYVSASPQQLFTALREFTHHAGFPDAVFTLKRVGFFDRYMSNLWISSAIFKPPAIRRIIERYPQRTFILVGDSTEHDPEIYGDVARRYTDRIIRIYIRHVGDKPVDSPRYERAFRDLPPEMWEIFRSAEELDDLPPAPPLQIAREPAAN